MMPTWCLTDALLWTKASKPTTPASLRQDQSQSSPESTMLRTGEWRERGTSMAMHTYARCVCMCTCACCANYPTVDIHMYACIYVCRYVHT